MAENINNLFNSFINDIIKVFPEYKGRLETYYKEILENNEANIENEKLQEFLKNIELISDKIVDKDVKVFEEDPVILQNVSFKLLWNSDISSQTKNSIWKYLQTFCMIKINIESNDKISEVIKSIESNEKVKDKETVKNMKKLQKLKENFDIQEIEKVISENPETISNGMNEMDQMFENTNIGKIAKEITDDLNIDQMIKEGGGIEDLFNGGSMMNIIQSISSKMGNPENQLNAGELMKEATDICGSMQGNPLFSSLMNMQGDMMKNEDIKNVNVSDSTHNPSKTRERLQKKLQEKKNLTVEKVD